MEILLSGAIANFSELRNEKFLHLLIEKFPETEFYKFQPTSGRIYAAAFDWKAVAKVADIVGIASFLWVIYTEFILPKKDPDSNSGIVIHIGNVGSNNHFWIGQNVNSQEELIKRLQDSLQQDKIDMEKNAEEIDSLRNSEGYKKIH